MTLCLTEIFSDCKDLKLFGNDSDGLYTVYPDPLRETPVVVYCDMTTDVGGWTVKKIQTDLKGGSGGSPPSKYKTEIASNDIKK